jgi:hypothetical protein
MTPTSRRIIVGAMIGIHLVADLLWPRFWWPLRTEMFMAAGVGFCVAQVNLVAVWAALAPGRVMVRLPWSLFLTALLWCAMVLGFRHGDGISSQGATTLGLVLLMGVIVAQIPLWVTNL